MFNQELIEDILDRACRYYVCAFLLLYGFGKLIGGQFYRRGELPEEVAALTLDQAPAFDLAWVFMGYSGAYIAFVGISQIIGSLLLLSERSKLLGVAILVPIMINIVVFDIIFLDTYAALFNAVLYLCMLFFILYFNREQIKQAFRALTQVRAQVKGAIAKRWQVAVATGTTMAIVFGFNYLLMLYFGYGKG